MSGVSLSDEFETLMTTFDINLDEMQWLSTNAMKSSFLAFDERLRLINGVIKPGYERLKAEVQAQSPRLV
jgi:adenosine deaminase